MGRLTRNNNKKKGGVIPPYERRNNKIEESIKQFKKDLGRCAPVCLGIAHNVLMTDAEAGKKALEAIGGYPLYANMSNITYEEAIAIASILGLMGDD